LTNLPEIPQRFRKIDETNGHEYHYILEGDQCYYIWERMSQVKVEYNKYPTNNLISNLQIPVSCRADNPWRFKHKTNAIAFAAEALSKLLPLDWRAGGTFVPIPPSKVEGDPEHDPRLVGVLHAVQPPLSDIRLFIGQRSNSDSKQKGLAPTERAENYYILEERAEPEPELVFLFDDVLTTGSHFKAAQRVIGNRFPGTVVVGLFLARAVRPVQNDVLDFF
jgi:hypothetical protein